MVLDNKFFERVKYTDHKGSRLESYKAVYARSTMVLFSRKTRTPLAALTLKADDVGCLSMLTGRPSPGTASEPYFQGMLNLPNQTFTFTISNLSDEGMINFNILHTPHRVSEVDPGPTYGVNQVNELHADQSYTIPADQRNNRRMILAGKTKTVKDDTTGAEKKVAVTVDETEAKENPTGLYFYLSVVADTACKSLVDKFAEGTTWKVVSGFVRKAQKPPEQMWGTRGIVGYREGGRSRGSLGVSRGSLGVSRGSLGVSRGSLGVSRGPPPGALYSMPNFRGMGNLESAVMAPSAGFALQRTTSQPEDLDTAPIYRSGMGEPLAGNMECEEEEDEDGGMDLFDSDSEPHSESTSAMEVQDTTVRSKGLKKKKSKLDSQKFSAPVDVGSTQAAELKYGQEVEVRSGYTGHDYAYEHCSEPTVLCLSIWEGMKFLGLENIEETLEAEVKEWMENEGKALIEALNAIFKADTCVIDLESEADTIVCTCGHQCLNHANVGSLRKCPMCRSPVTAFVQANGIMVS